MSFFVSNALVFPLTLGDGSLRHLEGLKVGKSKHTNGEGDYGGSEFKESSVRVFRELSLLILPPVYLRRGDVTTITLGLNRRMAAPSRFESNHHTFPNALYTRSDSDLLTTHADRTYDLTTGQRQN